jgi:hypothetical protein
MPVKLERFLRTVDERREVRRANTVVRLGDVAERKPERARPGQ